MALHKIVFLGDAGVGKTSIIYRLRCNKFSALETPTIGATFVSLNKLAEDLEIHVWDTAGQERYRSLIPLYYKGASLAIIVYDVSDPFSLDKVKSWIAELQLFSPKTKILIVGNKIDLGDHILELEGKLLSLKKDTEHCLTSARTGSGINELAQVLVSELREIPVSPKFKVRLEYDDKPTKKCYCSLL